MLVDIYSSNKHFGKYLTVPAGPVDDKRLAAVLGEFGSLKLVQASVDLVVGVPNEMLDVDDAVAQIAEKGYALHAYRRKRKT
jgi:hypothetical protein